jgi:hypothetical protein
LVAATPRRRLPAFADDVNEAAFVGLMVSGMAWDAVHLTLAFCFICPFVAIDPAHQGATAVVAPGRMIDNFLPIPDAESLPGVKASL